jgi:hypothetical protein
LFIETVKFVQSDVIEVLGLAVSGIFLQEFFEGRVLEMERLGALRRHTVNVSYPIVMRGRKGGRLRISPCPRHQFRLNLSKSPSLVRSSRKNAVNYLIYPMDLGPGSDQAMSCVHGAESEVSRM